MSPACTLHNFTINPTSFMRLSYKLVDTVRIKVPKKLQISRRWQRSVLKYYSGYWSCVGS